jgi:hypothetical protein
MPTKIMLFSILCVSLIGTLALSSGAYGQTTPIPNWLKNNAKWWYDGTISDEQYIWGLQYMISQGMIKTSNAQLTSNIALTNGPAKLITNVRTNSSYSIGYDGLGQISCNSGEILTGGGYNSGFRDSLSVYQNGPSADGEKWVVAARYTPGGPHGGIYRGVAPTFYVYAMCMKIAP